MIEKLTVRRLLAGSCILALAAVGCGGTDIRLQSERPEGPSFVTLVADSLDKVGIGVSVAAQEDGTPHLAYLAFLPEQEPGQPEPTNDPLGIQYPAVKHAHYADGAWTRSVVSEQPLPESDETPVPAATEEDAAAIALDADGVHHIVWTAGSHLLYSSNASGEFSEAEDVFSRGDLAAPGIAIGPDGTPVVSVFDGEAIWAAARIGGRWQVERIATAALGSPIATAITFAGGVPTVAYAGADGVSVARRGTQTWQVEVVDPAAGAGAAIATDADGNPHVSYYVGLEVRHAHSIGGAPWEASNVGETLGPDPGSGTSIAIDAQGVHHIAWDDGDGVAYATSAGGAFQEQGIPGALEGSEPALASGDEVVSLAWYDPVNDNVKLSILTEDKPLLALPETGEPTDAPTGGPPTRPPCEPSGTQLSIEASVSQFSTDCLAAPAGEPFTIEFTNQDAGLPHNVAIYTEQGGEPLFQGEQFPGEETRVYDVDPVDGGIFFFQCDVHPTTMVGTFVAN